MPNLKCVYSFGHYRLKEHMPRFVARDEKIEKRKKQKRNLTRVAGGLIDSTKKPIK